MGVRYVFLWTAHLMSACHAPLIMAYDVVGLPIVTVDSKSFEIALGLPLLIILSNLSP